MADYMEQAIKAVAIEACRSESWVVRRIKDKPQGLTAFAVKKCASELSLTAQRDELLGMLRQIREGIKMEGIFGLGPTLAKAELLLNDPKYKYTKTEKP